MVVTSIPVLRLLAVVAVFWNGAIASPTQAPDAQITPMAKVDVRQLTNLAYNDPRFVGWEVHGGSVYQRTCNTGYTYSVSNSHFQCCTTAGSCYFATGCAGLYTALFTSAPLSSVSCESSAVCVTGSLYWSTQDTNPYTFIGCGSSNYWVVQSTDSSGLLSWTPGVAAATNPTTQKGSTVTTSPPTTSTPAPGPTTVTTTPIPTAPSPAAAISATSGGGGGGSSNTGAIIGGAVGGGAVAIGLIILGILLFFRRRRNNAPAQPVTQPQQPYSNQPGQPPQDMRPMSYVPPGSPPPPWDGAYSQQHAMMAGKPPMQYQYDPVAKDDPHLQPQQYSPQVPQVPQAVEMQGTPATHPMELQGAQRQ